jgi:selenoprotein W-related protein
MPMQVTIEYCVPCGHLDRAIDIQRRLLTRYGRDLDAVTLQTGEGGVFKISIDDQLVLDAARDGFDLTAVTDAVRQRQAA